MTNRPKVGTKHTIRLSDAGHTVRVQGYWQNYMFLALMGEEYRGIPVSNRLIKVRVDMEKESSE